MANRQGVGELISEFIGTFLLVLLGDGVVAVAILTGAYSGQWQPSVLWGLTVTMIIYATGAVSGTHINPAVTLTMAAFRGFPRAKVLPYIAAQMAGGFLGAAALYGMMAPMFTKFEAAKNIVRGTAASEQTARVFSTYPHADLPAFNAFLVEIALTFCLLFVILAVTDGKNGMAPQGNFGPYVIGALVALLVGVGGPLTMAAINPARDWGPRIFAALAGWGTVAIPGPNGYAWVPLLGPVVGGLVAGVVYDRFVRSYIPGVTQQKSTDVAA